MQGHGGAVVRQSPPTSEVGNLLRWESWLLTDGQQLTGQNLDQMYSLVSSAQKTPRCDMTCTVFKMT